MTKESGNKFNLKKISIIAVSIIIGLWLLTFLLLFVDTQARGVFGDMFGSINSLFSGLALAGIILTILMQKQELEYQRQELKDTRIEFKTQNETLKLQRFENTFFSLLNLHHQIVNAMDYRYYKTTEKTGYQESFRNNEVKEVVILNGRDVFRRRFNIMQGELKIAPDKYKEIYIKNYTDAQTDFGHYFRNLYRMIKLVHETDFFYDTNKVTTSEIFKIKYRYTSIIRSQLSDFELGWIFYNCLTIYGEEKFKPLIEEYTLLKNVPNELLVNTTIKKLYKDSAFNPENN